MPSIDQHLITQVIDIPLSISSLRNEGINTFVKDYISILTNFSLASASFSLLMASVCLASAMTTVLELVDY